nr:MULTISPECIES: hypothetical protein [Brucella/Ochrobactrum group]
MLIDTIRYKLYQLDAKHSLTIVDPFLFPNGADPDYESDLFHLLAPCLQKCSQLTIVAGPKTHTPFRVHIENWIRSQSSINLTVKLVDEFHDRYLIADDKRGLFLGTSLNGVGKKYALVDFFQDQDGRQYRAAGRSDSVRE